MSDPQVKSIIERILRLHAEEAEIAADRREVYAEAKANGYDKTALGAAVRAIRQRDKVGEAAIAELETIVSLYLAAYDGPSRTHVHVPAREATDYQPARPSPERDPQSGQHGSDTGGGCGVEACEKPVYAKGYCSAHYNRLARHGSPLGGGTEVGAASRFYRNDVLGFVGEECLIWPFSRGSNGYGQITVDDATLTVSALACAEVHGARPSDLHEAAHSCGNGKLGCVSPKHLRWATRSENQADRVLHGTDSRGEKSGTAKLTEAAAREIASSSLKIAELAERFGISEAQVSRIRNGQRWAHMEPGSEAVASGGGGVTASPETRPAFTLPLAKPLRPHCQNPDRCGSYGSKHCDACIDAAGLTEARAYA